MFDYSLAHWAAFLSAAVLLNIAPGPDMAFILGQTVRGGVRRGFAAMLGVWVGVFGHITMAALGISALLAASAVAFSIVTWVGAAYLIGLGLRALWTAGDSLPEATAGPAEDGSQGRAFRTGVLINLLNPKVALFFLAFLPQFVEPGAGPTWAQLMLHGGLIVAIAALVEPPLVLAGGRMTAALRGRRAVVRWLDRGLGALFLGLGIRLATSSR
ncbi:LysE family translocator [Roseospira marina]|uniref:LysE family translocator n=1 Tax=Roseospira marina TaxID=140057 RepID=A0A5M6IA49_9PROT|nr:LysE family translocator [Roseospira marina]KAA5605130.1 LysE family translocator [Roseospira marina]MBB4314883.1 threonine/homoserine/homoserine lactone efflux protein [Roseospira marina]MBB5087883.1 threonine/homoserine/homoserine lactone efflux protein [Roseospira marina]